MPIFAIGAPRDRLLQRTHQPRQTAQSLAANGQPLGVAQQRFYFALATIRIDYAIGT